MAAPTKTVWDLEPHTRAKQLHQVAGAKFVRSFEMRNENNVTDYFLFYATNSLTGLARMKEAMWKVDEAGEFAFSDATNPNQIVLFEAKPRFDVLVGQVLARFAGSVVTVRDVEEFVLAETAFRETHYKRNVLRVLEMATPPKLEAVDPAPERKRGQYPEPAMRLRFL